YEPTFGGASRRARSWLRRRRQRRRGIAGLFFDCRQGVAQPRCLSRQVGSGQPLARPLHRELELVKKSRHVMVVIANAEPLLDQVADHRSSPYPGLIASLHRSELDDDRQRFPLFFGEFGSRTLRDPSSQTLDVIGVVPLEPTI